ncbi:MAG: hypothetical protein AcusKO_46350 [Acuticoccus sp.]
MRQPKILTTLKTYTWSLFAADLFAGITVAMVAIPLSLAIAIASGADPEDGIVTAIVGGLLISLLGGSRVQIGGPTGAFIVVVFGVIAEHGYDGLVLATLMAGLILLVAGFFRAGRLIAYVPEAVVNGFTIGIALIIATTQLKDLGGFVMAQPPAEFLAQVSALWSARETLNAAALLLAVFTMAVIIAVRRVAPWFPGPILAVAAASALAALGGLSVDTIGARFGEVSAVLPAPALPQVSLERVVELLPSAIIIAFLAGVESLLSAMVADRMVAGRHRPNAELLAQGTANVASALFAGLPATGAIARTATNVRAGGRTPVAGIVHALTILVVMLLAGNLVGDLAMPALAGLLMMTAWNMSEPHKWRGYWAAPATERFLLVSTLVLTVAVDLTVAIGVGVSVGLALRLRARSKSEDSDWTMPER